MKLMNGLFMIFLVAAGALILAAYAGVVFSVWKAIL